MHARRRVKSSRLNENAEKRNDYAVVRKRFMYAKCGTLTRVRSEYYEVGCPVLADSFSPRTALHRDRISSWYARRSRSPT